MNFSTYLANECADVTGLSSSGREFYRQLPLNLIDLCPRELCVCSRWRCSLELVLILSKVIGENGWQFFSDDKYSYEQISEFDKFMKSESIKICVKFDNGSIT